MCLIPLKYLLSFYSAVQVCAVFFLPISYHPHQPDSVSLALWCLNFLLLVENYSSACFLLIMGVRKKHHIS